MFHQGAAIHIPIAMSSITENWFLNDEQYYANTEDYALPCSSAKLIRREIDEGNKSPFSPSDKFPEHKTVPRYFSEALQRHKHYNIYNFVGAGTLVYADVDDANPDHAKEIKELQGASQEKLESGSEASKSALDALVAHFIEDEQFKKYWAQGVFDHNGERVEDPDLVQKAKAHWVEQWLNNTVVYPKVLTAPVANYMAGPGHEHSAELLNIISEQDHLKNKRPVMIVDDIIDSLQEPANDAKRGWVTGYDIVKNELIIKPFFSDKTSHPLGSSWNSQTPDDGVSGRWKPLDFLHAYIHLAHLIQDQISNKTILEVETKSAENRAEYIRDLQLPDPSLAFRMYIHTLAARTFFQLWKGMVEYHSPTPEEAATLKTSAQHAYTLIKSLLRRIPFPAASRDKLPEQAVYVVPPVLTLAWRLDDEEDCFRRAVLDLKEFGEEAMAENTRFLYRRIVGMVKAFNEDPRGVDVKGL